MSKIGSHHRSSSPMADRWIVPFYDDLEARRRMWSSLNDGASGLLTRDSMVDSVRGGC
jgi:hypothetical protein